MTTPTDLHSYYTNKLTRWKGNYPRIFTLTTHGLSTSNPADSTLTNSWQWVDIFAISPSSSIDHPNGFQLVHRKGEGRVATDTMRFETPDRTELLSNCLQMISSFARGGFVDTAERAVGKFDGEKYCSPPTPLDSLIANLTSLDTLLTSGERKSYPYKDIDVIYELTTSGVFAVRRRGSERVHTFTTPTIQPLLSKLMANSSHYLGHTINLIRTNDSLSNILGKRLGIYSNDSDTISLSEFTVQNGRRVRRLLCLSERCLVERDHASYKITSIYGLSTISTLVRRMDDAQMLDIEFNTGKIKTFYSTERDNLLASVMDGARAGGNTSIHVQSTPTNYGWRWGGVTNPVEEKVESLFLKFLHQPPVGWSFCELLGRFCANVEYGGLVYSESGGGIFSENKEKLILVGINALITHDVVENEVELFFQVVRRLVCSKTGFSAFSEMLSFRTTLGSLLTQTLRSPTTTPTTLHTALETISALLQPMHSSPDLRLEQENKEKILNSQKFLESLLDTWTTHVSRGTGALVTIAMLDILTFSLCAPYSETTLGGQFDGLLGGVAARVSVLFGLLRGECLAVVRGAGLLMKSLIEEGPPPIPTQIQDLALKEGALIRHLLTALYTNTTDPRLLTLRQLSRHLIELWTCGHKSSNELLGRIFPPGLLLTLSSSGTPPTPPTALPTRDNLSIATSLLPNSTPLQRNLQNLEKFCEKQIETALKHWRFNVVMETRKNVALRPVTLRKRRQNLSLEGNWAWFWWSFGVDGVGVDLVWNFQTREELRIALETEIRLLDNDREHTPTEIHWNHTDFQVTYKSLSDEIRVGGYYLRLLLDEKSNLESVREPKEFFAELYHRFLLTGKPELRGMCLQAMTIIYTHYNKEIGIFNDLKYIIMMLEKSSDKTERDLLVLFLQSLVLHQENARELVTCGGLKVLVDLVTLAHLHRARAPLPTTSNVLEAGSDMKQLDSPEWYYMKDGQKLGPVGFQELKNLYTDKLIDGKCKIWASGLDSWKSLSSIPQTKWFIISKSPSLMNESKLATVILDVLIRILEFCPARAGSAVIRPVHRAKQILTDANICLPHIVQALLTFDPAIVERVAKLLTMLLDSSPSTPRIYSTGVYFFIMMYTGSNILPISRFLHLTHLKQNTWNAKTSTSIWNKSVLGSMLPEAMVAVLENHGVDKFSEIFLGEFDTPEAIWSAEMRRHLIERIALHLADFTPRITSNTRAIYDYISIPSITYANLEKELFCGDYYLRNLTDSVRFPSWPITSPLQTLRSVLTAWKSEVEKKPPPMTVTEALANLELSDHYSPDTVKKAYRRLAQLYHPDKNPGGRARFESANRAYEFLCSRHSSESLNPDVNRIILILKAQSILFGGYGEVLAPYKYSGYPMLIKTIEIDLADPQLFAKSEPLLPHSTEVLYHTLACSELNVEELRRERGLDLLLKVFDRCLSVVNASSKPEDVGVLVCTHVTRSFTVATRFQLCRDKLVEMPQLANLVCSLFRFKHLTNLSRVAAECVAAMSIDTILQMQLLQSGVLWHLLASLFSYDYTLEESSIPSLTSSTHSQLLTNNYCKASVTALKSLCGDDTTPKNDVIRTSLEKLLLPYGAMMILTATPETTLKTLNSNTTSPYLIWDNKSRSELLEYCQMQLKLLRDGDITDMTYGSGFSYSIHEGELIIGSIFIRIYTTTPSFTLDDPTSFINALLVYLSTTDCNISPSAIVALSIALKSNPGLENLVKGKFRLFSRLLLEFDEVLGLLGVVFGSGECVDDSVGSGILPALMVLLIRSKDLSGLILDCLEMMAGSGLGVKEGLRKGLPLYLLQTFTNPHLENNLRSKASSIISRLTSDKATGPRIKLFLAKLLPPVFTDTMVESPEGSVALFDGECESPELLWNATSRATLSFFLTTQLTELYTKQSTDLSYDWNFNIDTLRDIHESSEIVVGGIYLRVYNNCPSYAVRRPRDFLKDLMEHSFNLPTDDCVKSINILLSTNTHLIDSLVHMGYVGKVVGGLNNNTLRRFCVEVVRFFGRSRAVVGEMGPTSLTQITTCLSNNHHIDLLAESLQSIFSNKNPDLVKHALKTELIPVLLSFLKGKDALLEDTGNSPSSIKANIVSCLQKHDLFLESHQTSGYLTGGSSGRYLTEGEG